MFRKTLLMLPHRRFCGCPFDEALRVGETLAITLAFPLRRHRDGHWSIDGGGRDLAHTRRPAAGRALISTVTVFYARRMCHGRSGTHTV